LWNPLTEKQIKEAIEYGKNQNNLLYGGEKIDFELSKVVATTTEWEQAKGWSRIETPFHALAVAAREKSRRYIELSISEINAICEKYSGKFIFVQQFGTFYIPVANQFHCIIKKNREIIQPIAKEVIYNKIYFPFP